jgi:hypothetical protein
MGGFFMRSGSVFGLCKDGRDLDRHLVCSGLLGVPRCGRWEGSFGPFLWTQLGALYGEF